ncbi:MAG TPA: MarR family transcriptional regulator [Thermotogota bacterium]|jgi:DNA-binding MarR family transcriptional regulator|nr:MarR family transcriptional regulator [Thermotogota bacterium]MDD8053137.1 MarR family transcriptional regulator [Thermotogota bacterium]HPB87162.1 MarR family transcriptional regulator [Thermotogota bacterium]HPH11090.1 MarR family transcriptional regulator [Thermotogota bacterium]HPM21418.1 MarR family transcriptional regulator [Thermotogota bacterium]
MVDNDGLSAADAPTKYAELERSLRRLAAWIKAEGRKVIKEGNYKITPAQFDVLQRVYWGDSTMSNLSNRLGVAKSTITGLIMKLKDAGYVDYSVLEEDHRVRKVVITPKGKSLIQEVIRRRVLFVERLFVTVDPFLTDEFRKVLRIVNNTLDMNEANESRTT